MKVFFLKQLSNCSRTHVSIDLSSPSIIPDSITFEASSHSFIFADFSLYSFLYSTREFWFSSKICCCSLKKFSAEVYSSLKFLIAVFNSSSRILRALSFSLFASVSIFTFSSLAERFSLSSANFFAFSFFSFSKASFSFFKDFVFSSTTFFSASKFDTDFSRSANSSAFLVCCNSWLFNSFVFKSWYCWTS